MSSPANLTPASSADILRIVTSLEANMQSMQHLMEQQACTIKMQATQIERLVKKMDDYSESTLKSLNVMKEALSQANNAKTSQSITNSSPQNQQEQSSLNRGKIAMAQKYYKVAVQHFEDVLTCINSKAETSNSNDVSLYDIVMENLVRCQIELMAVKDSGAENLKNYTEELWNFREKQIELGSITVDTKKRKELALSVGLGYLNQQKYEHALDYFKHTVDINAYTSDESESNVDFSNFDMIAFYALGYCQEQLKNYRTAQISYELCQIILKQNKANHISASCFPTGYKLLPGVNKLSQIDYYTLKKLFFECKCRMIDVYESSDEEDPGV